MSILNKEHLRNGLVFQFQKVILNMLTLFQEAKKFLDTNNPIRHSKELIQKMFDYCLQDIKAFPK